MHLGERRGPGLECTATFGEARYTIDLPPKAEIEVAAPDYLADSVVHSSHRAMMRLARGLTLGVGRSIRYPPACCGWTTAGLGCVISLAFLSLFDGPETGSLCSGRPPW